MAMLNALLLALGDLTKPQVLRVFLKSMAVTLLVFAAFAIMISWVLTQLFDLSGLDRAMGETGSVVLDIAAVGGGVAAALLGWRIIALAVLQLFADEVVAAVETTHYPRRAATARTLGWPEELAASLKGAGRALVSNLLALPLALALLVTGVGAPLVFLAVNAVLLGRELQDMVWLRHRRSTQAPAPLSRPERWTLGALTAILLSIPIVNLFAAFAGAAAATHLIHRKDPDA